MLRFAVCPGCKMSMTLPDDYVLFGPWMAAHSKVCPGEGTPRVIAKVKRVKGKKPEVSPDVDAAKLVGEVGEKVARALLNGALDNFFKGSVK